MDPPAHATAPAAARPPQRLLPQDAHPSFERILSRLPASVLALLDDAALNALAEATRPTSAPHVVDFRASTRWRRKWYYIRLLIAEERRSATRLAAENQLSVGASLMWICVLGWIATSAALAAILFLAFAIGLEFLSQPSALAHLFD